MREQQVQEMHDLYSDGLSLADVGTEYNVTASRVRQLFRAAGLQTRTREEAVWLRRAASDLQANDLLQLFAATNDLKTAAAAVGLTELAARRVIRKRASGPVKQRSANGRVPNGYWTRDRVIQAIQEWARLYGTPPSTTDWNLGQAKRLGHHDKVKRFQSGLWPHVNTVRAKFGGWNDAIRAAGLEPVHPSSYARRGDDPEIVQQAVNYYRDGDPLSVAARRAHISVVTLRKASVRAGLPLPNERLVQRIKAFLRGRDWTPARTITFAVPDPPSRIYGTLHELRRDPELEFMEMAGRGLFVRPRKPLASQHYESS